MIISLLGYMGSGKTHISKKLSQKIHYKSFDLDDEIIQKNQKSIAEIFTEKGEIYFRKQEKEILEQILHKSEDIILSLGGGTPAYYNNMEIINEKSKSIFLRTNVPTLTERLIAEKESRPLISKLKDEDLPEYIAKHLFERNHFYNQAQFTVTTDFKTPEEIVNEIEKLIFI